MKESLSQDTEGLNKALTHALIRKKVLTTAAAIKYVIQKGRITVSNRRLKTQLYSVLQQRFQAESFRYHINFNQLNCV